MMRMPKGSSNYRGSGFTVKGGGEDPAHIVAHFKFHDIGLMLSLKMSESRQYGVSIRLCRIPTVMGGSISSVSLHHPSLRDAVWPWCPGGGALLVRFSGL